MTRDKERLAEEVIELKRVNDDVVTRLKLAQAEVIRATGELRKRERALEALERGDDDGGAARRATRVLELEAENEVYLSEVARLASLLRLDPETGQLPGTSAGPSPDVPGADDEATPSNETGFPTASSAEVARLRAERFAQPQQPDVAAALDALREQLAAVQRDVAWLRAREEARME